MVDVLVIVEGGGSTRSEQAPLRKGFSELFAKLLGSKRKPQVMCAGGRSEAFQNFKTFVKANPNTLCFLLVDSEGPVAPESSPWEHVASRLGDGWQQPAGVTDEHLHFMMEAMEAWLVADPDALAGHYGSGFKKEKLPKRANLEEVSKAALAKALDAATKDVKTKGKYQKSHGFVLIGKLDPAKIRRACPKFAKRFFEALEERASYGG
ncbi:DUF4276 family protein [Stigmatella sp. ncwal1]|uniref:DUF4276 family protein n=1 Tax=Stigmatella ashevillensis TaxID=2995309 RepID=A0ABT5DDG8_9BACT|nr:DUF4276 family protein [Stigmatella ashevillena]MDC0711730.1 DUF4276 family protein [Stigmatella ashevillena]